MTKYNHFEAGKKDATNDIICLRKQDIKPVDEWVQSTVVTFGFF